MMRQQPQLFPRHAGHPSALIRPPARALPTRKGLDQVTSPPIHLQDLGRLSRSTPTGPRFGVFFVNPPFFVRAELIGRQAPESDATVPTEKTIPSSFFSSIIIDCSIIFEVLSASMLVERRATITSLIIQRNLGLKRF